MNDITEKIGTLIERAAARRCFAVPGTDSIIDLCGEDGLSKCYRANLEEICKRHPGAVEMTLDAFCADKGARQDAEPKVWTEVTEERYWEMLGVLPPAAQARGAFLVGEAYDHHASTGRPRFQCFKRDGGKWFSLSNPITHAQFCEMFGKCSNQYSG